MSDSGTSQKHSGRLWLLAALGAVALHLGCVAFAVANLHGPDDDDDLGAQGAEIGFELAAPHSTPSDLPPGPDTDASAASTAVPQQKAVLKQSDLPMDTPTETDDPDRLVSPDNAKHPQDDDPNVPKVQATPSNESVASEATAMPSSEAVQQSEKSVTVTQGSGEAKQRARATWQKELSAHLDRHKRYPAERGQQSAKIVVNFVLDRRGHVLSSSIVESSGDTAFDEAALSMLKRSDPVPPPPPLIADDTLSFTVPVLFRVKGKG
jgi:TonB family protein